MTLKAVKVSAGPVAHHRPKQACGLRGHILEAGGANLALDHWSPFSRDPV